VSSISPARDVAARVLKRVEQGGYASDALRVDSTALAARDAALAEAIVLGSLRYQAQLDYLIAFYAGRPQPKLDPEVLIALRMGIYQLRYLDRIPSHAAVTESVELVKQSKKKSASGFVNAVLRKVNREPVKWPDRATELSVPGWMLERWDRHYGKEIAEGIARAALEEPEAYVNPATGRQQDIGAQSIVPLLDLRAGMILLDLCAAPGNKTAQAVEQGARVIACDRYLRRLEEVNSTVERVVLDATDALPFSRKFDRILVDAPCSGTGTLGHNPEIKWRLKPGDPEVFAVRQREMLERAMELLAPGGKLVYSTCALESEENENAVAGFDVMETHVRIPGREPGDGFFAAVITST